MILGIDEVGRGPWAGPLVVGAVVLGDAKIDGLTDSKKLTKKKRDALDILIREQASGYGLGWVEAKEIDEIGLGPALRLATIRAVEQVKAPYHEIIIDGTINFLSETAKGRYVTTLAKADLLIQSVSAASIIAKVARDNYMALQDDIYPGYGFVRHVGYGTLTHRNSIEKLGVTPLHRLSFAPLAKYKTEITSEFVPRTTKRIGDDAESAVARYLESHGHTVLERNWKTKFCEIDIVSVKGETFYFSEVKYRKNPIQGSGLEAITHKKQQQMIFAAEFYMASHKLQNVAMRLVAVSVSGTTPTVETYLEIE
ncbi:MAG: putative Ribonuclease [Candidatus Saccharibacteria bacterium]|nr:putative Ribonuclease [Candidatus Saccharibacteria bacterium]